MIEWLRRHPGSSPFLITEDRVWSYSETADEVEARTVTGRAEVDPTMSPDSVFDLLAGLSGGSLALPPPGGPAAGPTQSPGDGDWPLLTVYTSGTTGRARGVRLTFDNLEAACSASMQHLGHGSSDVWLLALPLRHVGGLSILLRSAFAGGAVYLLPAPDSHGIARALRERVTLASLVSTMVTRVLDLGPGGFTGLRAVVLGGGPIPSGLLERGVDAGLPLLPSYGMTETFGQVATLRPGSPPDRKAHPLPGIELRIEGDGCVAVAGRQVSPGYLGEPDRADRWLKTNDLGVIEPDGALRIIGRADSMIITGGHNVSPEAVEGQLARHPGVEAVVVVGVPDDEWGESVVCLYSGSASTEVLSGWARSELPGHMVPKRYIRVDEVPTTLLGKPDRAAAARLSGL